MMKINEYLELEAENDRFSHAYLFIGKNEDQQVENKINLLIQLKHCLPEDVSRLAPLDEEGKKSNIKVDQVRELLHQINLSPQGESRIVIIYNCEKLNQSSGNILLKSLEEPPKNLTFILTAETDSILPTIKSRCRILRFSSSIPEVSDEKFAPIFRKDFFEASKEIDKIITDNKVAECLEELILVLRRKMLQEGDKETASNLREVFRIKREIGQNANEKLALEYLTLILEKAI